MGLGTVDKAAEWIEKSKTMLDLTGAEISIEAKIKNTTKICPILATANFPQLSACMREECAMWNRRSECCGLICPKTSR